MKWARFSPTDSEGRSNNSVAIAHLTSTNQSPNVSTTPLRQWGFRQCLPFSWTTLRGKHCRHPIAVMGVVDTFEHRLLLYLENHGVSSEYLNFFFRPAIISCVQLEFMMTYSIFATRETIFLDLFTFTQQQLQPLQQQTFK